MDQLSEKMTKGALRELADYYEKNRAVGHTRTLLRGIEEVESDNPPILVARTKSQAHLLTEQVDAQAVSVGLHNLPHDLTGRHGPLVIDNSVQGPLLRKAHDLIQQKESKIGEYRDKWVKAEKQKVELMEQVEKLLELTGMESVDNE